MEENCSIKLFESDLESMLSQVIATEQLSDGMRYTPMQFIK